VAALGRRKEKLLERLAFQEERFRMREDVREMLAMQRLLANKASFQRKEQIIKEFEKLMVSGSLSTSRRRQLALIPRLFDRTCMVRRRASSQRRSSRGRSRTSSGWRDGTSWGRRGSRMRRMRMRSRRMRVSPYTQLNRSRFIERVLT
jgi:hypothetical protein